MKLEIENRDEVKAFFRRARVYNQPAYSSKRFAPVGAEFDDGTPVKTCVDRWIIPATGESVKVRYKGEA